MEDDLSPPTNTRSRQNFWRDGALDGALLMDAHYKEHTFERHLHDEMVIVVTEHGSGEVRTRQGLGHSRPGTVWVFAAGEYHNGRVFQDVGWDYRAIYLDDRALDAVARVFDEGRCERRPFVPPGLYDDAELASALAAAHRSLHGQGSMLERQALWWDAMGLLFGRHGQPRVSLPTPGNERARLRVARDYVCAHYRRDFSIDELSHAAGLSRFHLMRSFRKEYGLPPHAYANQLKLIDAKRMLQSGLPAADVAAEVGFYDQSHLTRLFKRAFALTPGRFAALTQHG